MADIIDQAQEQAEQMLALQQAQRRVTNVPKTTTHCLYCNALLTDPRHRWCDSDCRDDYETEQVIRRASGTSK